MLKHLWNYALFGTIIIILGIIIMVGSINLYTSIVNLFVFVFLIHSISSLWKLMRTKEWKMEQLICTIITILFAVLMNILKNIPLSIVPILFAIYLLFNGIVKTISAYFLWKNGQTKIREIVLSFLFFLSGISFLFSPLKHLPTLLSIMGFYCILLGLAEWRDLLLEIFPLSISRRNIHISLPTFLDAFIPRRMLTKINCYFNDHNIEKRLQVQKETAFPDLEIFIHVAPHGFNQLGHMDICFNGKVISYGNYDASSYRMFESIGDGVLFETIKDTYIPFCIAHSKKTLIGFGLKLTEKQKSKVNQEIEKIKKDTYLWDPTIIKNKEKANYINLLYKMGAKIYKFRTGEFKTYFVLGRNCTRFADRIVGKSGTDILKMAGIITPGSYLEYLEREFTRKNSMVISKTIYHEITEKIT